MRLQNLMRLFTISLVLFALISCEYNDYPDAIWDPNDAGDTTPTIVSMDPASLAFEGITKATITGLNYSAVLTENQVTFNGIVAEIDPDNSTAGSLVVTVPVIIADAELNALDSVQVIVAVQGAYAGAVYGQAFRVERAVIEWGGFAGEKPAKNPNAVACDASEDVYVAATDKIMYKVDGAGTRTALGTGIGDIQTDLKAGPDGYLYFARNFPFVYRMTLAGVLEDRWHRPTGAKKVVCLDFDIDQNIYCAGKNESIYKINVAAASSVAAAPALDYNYISLRVYDGYVYVAGRYEGLDPTVTLLQAIWRFEIIAGQDALGTRELVYDWSENTLSVGQDITTMIVDENGLFYVGATAGDGPGIIILDPTTKAVEAFYDAVLTAPVSHLSWGNGTYIYGVTVDVENTEETAYIPIRISQNSNSAPNYGRN